MEWLRLWCCLGWHLHLGWRRSPDGIAVRCLREGRAELLEQMELSPGKAGRAGAGLPPGTGATRSQPG